MKVMLLDENKILDISNKNPKTTQSLIEGFLSKHQLVDRDWETKHSLI